MKKVVDVQFRYDVIIDLEQQAKTVALLGKLALIVFRPSVSLAQFQPSPRCERRTSPSTPSLRQKILRAGYLQTPATPYCLRDVVSGKK